jgi:hypothetical protein
MFRIRAVNATKSRAVVGQGISARSQPGGRRARRLSPGEGFKGTKKGPNRTDAPGLARTDGRPIFRGKTGGGPLVPSGGGSAVSGFDSRRLHCHGHFKCAAQGVERPPISGKRS